MNYSESTYELDGDLILGDIEYKDTLKAHFLQSKKPTKTQLKQSLKAAEEAMCWGYKLIGRFLDPVKLY
jgi:hypothetical protein